MAWCGLGRFLFGLGRFGLLWMFWDGLSWLGLVWTGLSWLGFFRFVWVLGLHWLGLGLANFALFGLVWIGSG